MNAINDLRGDADQPDDTMLIGPACEHSDGGLWGFCVIAGRSTVPGDASTELVTATNPMLLLAVRGLLIQELEQTPWLKDALHFDDELHMAQAAEMRWPGVFEELVSLIVAKQAGGGVA